MWIFVGLFMLAIALFVLAYGYKMIKAFYLDGIFKTFLFAIFIIFVVGGIVTFIASIAGPSDGLLGAQIQIILFLSIPIYTIFYFWLKHVVKKNQQNNNNDS